MIITLWEIVSSWNKSFYTVDNSICNCTKKKKKKNTASLCLISISLSYGRKTRMFLKFVNLQLPKFTILFISLIRGTRIRFWENCNRLKLTRNEKVNPSRNNIKQTIDANICISFCKSSSDDYYARNCWEFYFTIYIRNNRGTNSFLAKIMQRHWKTGFVFLSRTGSIRQGRINRLGNVLRVRESRQGWDVNKDFTTTMHRAERLS